MKMQTFTDGTFTKVHVLRLDRGDYLLESIENFVKSNNIRNAVVLSGIGTLDYCVLHMVMTTGLPPVNHCEKWEDKPLEITSIDGIIADGSPHLHITLSDHKCAYAGHLEHGCRILYLGEIVIAEMDGFNFHRVRNKDGILELTNKN
ncbi:MAG: DNA-binding protein [Treponema sp.]|jgi:predicted DNA-binding protein with PD1-like motif|nr:DNA-binding protein [Treponema sp.]